MGKLLVSGRHTKSRSGLSQGRSHQLVIQHQTVSAENIGIQVVYMFSALTVCIPKDMNTNCQC